MTGVEKQAESSLEAFTCFLVPGPWKAIRGAGETAQWEKVLAVKPDDTSSIPYRGATWWKERNRPLTSAGTHPHNK